jgi:cell division protein FtsQ
LAASAHLGHRYLSQPGKLPLRVVEITGEFSHLKHTAIEAEVAAAIDGGFFTVDMQAVRDAVRAMPWVEEVSVRRVWPDTLRMHVIEQVPLAHWGAKALVNLRGEVFQSQGVAIHGELPRLRGKDERATEVVAFYLHLRSALVGSDLGVSDLGLNERQEWEVLFDNGLGLMLGEEDPEARMAEFLQVYPQLVANMSRVPERIDMRYEHGFAVRWQPLEAPQGESLAGDS